MLNLGLIGYPIGHSLSPWIHERFLKITQLKGKYETIEIPLELPFDKEMNRLKKQNIHGFNVTIPYKEKIIPYLDELDDEAKNIGAVNTVLNKNGKWIGYNTDARGYLRALRHYYPSLLEEKDNKILILGAGGAARAIYYGLIVAGFKKIDLANRTIESARKLLDLKIANIETNVLTLQEAEKLIHTYDLIIQTTSVGMNPNADEMIIEMNTLKEDAIVSDIVYRPLVTKFLKRGEELGAKIHHGHAMLLFQAQYSFEIWTNTSFHMDEMEKEMYEMLKGR